MTKRNTTLMRCWVLAAAITLLLTFGVPLASADTTFSSTLDFANCSGGSSGCLSGSTTGPYGSVLVTLTGSTTATIQFTTASGYLFTDGSSVAVNGQFTLTPGTISGNCSGCSYTLANNLPAQVDGLGQFSLVIDSGDSSPSARSSSISFGVTANSGVTWAGAADVLQLNPNYDAAAHIYVDGGSSSGLTGFAGEDAGGHITGNTPEPSSIALLGGALLLTVRTLRRSHKPA